tara:strand:- start:53751 stop:54497 length:747 start_codon:yes stop_codon:yes gene_type:complete
MILNNSSNNSNNNNNTQPKSRKKKNNLFNTTHLNKLKTSVELNTKQKTLNDIIRNNSLTVVSGPAGTSKTFSTCYTALELLANKKIEEIILTKPLLESSFSMGFLPGSIEEKIEPYMKSYISTFKKLIGVEKFQELMINDVIKIETLNFMRGETYDNSILLLDEGQNLEMKDLMLWITRLGKDSKAVLMGDMSQYDVRENQSDFGKFRDILNGMNDFSIFEFSREDIVRNPFLIEVTDRYEKWKYNIE